MLRSAIISYVFVCSLLVAFNLGSASAESVPKSVKVGLILPLSGDWAFLGNGIRDGALLAVEDLRSKTVPIKLIFEDNQGDVATSVGIARRLIDVERVDALISIISGVAKVIRPLAAQAHVLSIGICSDTDAADGEYSFVNYLTAEQGVSKFLQQYRSSGSSSLGIFSLNEAGFLKIVEELKRQGKGSLDIRFIETYDKGAIDFRASLLKTKKKNPQAFLILGLSPEIELLVKQARSIGINTPVTSIEGFGLASDKTPFEGSWFIDSAVPDQAFRQRFKETYGREVTPGVGHAYDTVLLISESFQNRSTELKMKAGEQAAENFRRIDHFKGALGVLKVRPDGIIWSDPTIKMIKNGQPVLIEP